MDRGLAGIKSQAAAPTCPIISSHCQQHHPHHLHSTSSTTISARSTKTSSYATAASELVLSPPSIPLRQRQRCRRSIYHAPTPPLEAAASASTPASPATPGACSPSLLPLPPTTSLPRVPFSSHPTNPQHPSGPATDFFELPDSSLSQHHAGIHDDTDNFYAHVYRTTRMSPSQIPDDYPEDDSASFLSMDEPQGPLPLPSGPHPPLCGGIHSLPLPGVRCPTCAQNGAEVWVIPGRACGYCGTPCV